MVTLKSLSLLMALWPWDNTINSLGTDVGTTVAIAIGAIMIVMSGIKVAQHYHEGGNWIWYAVPGVFGVAVMVKSQAIVTFIQGL